MAATSSVIVIWAGPASLPWLLLARALRESNPVPAEKRHLRGLEPRIVNTAVVFRKFRDVFGFFKMQGWNIVVPFGRRVSSSIMNREWN